MDQEVWDSGSVISNIFQGDGAETLSEGSEYEDDSEEDEQANVTLASDDNMDDPDNEGIHDEVDEADTIDEGVIASEDDDQD